MYDELIKRLKNCATQAAPCKTCDLVEDGSCSDTLMKQAADAIEELSAAEKKYLANISALEAENQHLKRERDWIPVGGEKRTNGDAIRAMTDEELAEWISCNCTGDGYGNSEAEWLDWLKQEVSE